MPKTKTITHDDVIITVSESTNRIGRDRLARLKALQDNAEYQSATDDDKALMTLLCPLTACVVSHTFKDWPLTFEQFLDLPEALTDQWVDAVQALNPHWWGRPDAPAELEKKAI